MAKAYVFYNPLAGNKKCTDEVKKLENMISDPLVLCDMTKSETYEQNLYSLDAEDYIILCGGDGTLNRFVNLLEEVDVKNDTLYFPCGSGNDFALDLGHTRGDKPFSIKEYLKELPTVTVNGKKFHFINGVGYGIDGYCCEEGDRLRETSAERINYTSIAIKGLLFHYKPTGAKVTVDGQTHTYKKVWLAPTMYGRFYGGGMLPAPNQRRGDKKLSVMIMHDMGKLRSLIIFPSIFKGEHVKHKRTVDVFEGQTITVEFNRPTPLQIDGETISNVTSYTAQR